MREISEQEYQELNANFSIKAEYEKQAGKDVSSERFLYCCYEISKHIKAGDISFAKIRCWPGLEGSDLVEAQLDTNISNLCKWFKSNHPVLATKKAIDFDTMWHICLSLSQLEQAFSTVVQKSTGEIPEEHILDEGDLTGVWCFYKKALDKYLPEISEWAWNYYVWAYGITPPKEEVNISEIPPVGRYSRRNPTRTDNRNNSSRSTYGKRDQKKYSKDRDNFKNKNDRKKGPRPGRNSNQANAEKEKAVLNLVDSALTELKKGKKEIVLAPQNSFFRRIQHKHANDLGYETESIGEGRQRAVKIFKSQSD